jgi:hypothetical protein
MRRRVSRLIILCFTPARMSFSVRQNSMTRRRTIIGASIGLIIGLGILGWYSLPFLKDDPIRAPIDLPLLQQAGMNYSSDGQVVNVRFTFTTIQPERVWKAWMSQLSISSASLEFGGASIPIDLNADFGETNCTKVMFSLPKENMKDAKLVFSYIDSVPQQGQSGSFSKSIMIADIPFKESIQDAVQPATKSWQSRIQIVEQAGTGQPATRAVLESEGSDKPQPESEGRSR